MQHQHHSEGSQFGAAPQSASDTSTFPPSETDRGGAASGRMAGIQEQPPEAVSPISSRPPINFAELGHAVAGNFAEEEALASAGDDAERGSLSGNRWPRPETLALLRIRSEMDAVFREATLKGPLWEEVSRKLAELGYKRSGKKCKEKFENVHKYYKRTKDGRAGRQDGKSYRFFTELEALHAGAISGTKITPIITTNTASAAAFPTIAMSGPPAGRTIPALPISASAPVKESNAQINVAGDIGQRDSSGAAGALGGIIFSSNSSSSSSEFEDSDEGTEDAAAAGEEGVGGGRKRRREGERGSRKKKMIAFFEGLMSRVIERQEAMQRQFLETVEKREQERMAREEAWRSQEIARLGREHEQLAQERAMAASRDASLISCLQKISAAPIPTILQSPVVVDPTANAALFQSPLPSSSPQQPPAKPTAAAAPPQQPLKQSATPMSSIQSSEQQQQQHPQQQTSSSMEVMTISENQEGAGGSGGFEGPASNRWPRAEVLALIELRSGLESRYQEAGPKGPLWDEISNGMQRRGYNRNPKRCKEKWENINKYFKKVKESKKRRPEDAKTCPYFHQLDALYRQKQLVGGGSTSVSSSSGAAGIQRLMSFGAPERAEPISVLRPHQDPLAEQPAIAPADGRSKNGSNDGSDNGGESRGGQVQTSNGGHHPGFEQGVKKKTL